MNDFQVLRGHFVGPLQAVSLGNSVVNEVNFKAFSLIVILIGTLLLKELIKSFIQELTLLLPKSKSELLRKSCYKTVRFLMYLEENYRIGDFHRNPIKYLSA